MAKKKADKPVDASEVALKPVRLDLTPEVHRILRLLAADSGVSMASYARDALFDHLMAEIKRRKIPH